MPTHAYIYTKFLYIYPNCSEISRTKTWHEHATHSANFMNYSSHSLLLSLSWSHREFGGEVTIFHILSLSIRPIACWGIPSRLDILAPIQLFLEPRQGMTCHPKVAEGTSKNQHVKIRINIALWRGSNNPRVTWNSVLSYWKVTIFITPACLPDYSVEQLLVSMQAWLG